VWETTVNIGTESNDEESNTLSANALKMAAVQEILHMQR
jgi:hypothetical protein